MKLITLGSESVREHVSGYFRNGNFWAEYTETIVHKYPGFYIRVYVWKVKCDSKTPPMDTFFLIRSKKSSFSKIAGFVCTQA